MVTLSSSKSAKKNTATKKAKLSDEEESVEVAGAKATSASRTEASYDEMIDEKKLQ